MRYTQRDRRSGGPMEIEAKFRVEDDQTFPALLGLGALGSFRLVAAPRAEA